MKKKNDNNKKLDVVFILDKSGSMSGSEESTISSYNEYLEKEKNNKFDTKITTVLFSDTYKYLYKNIDINKVDKLTHEDYFVGGCTALYDALGSTINYFDSIDTDKVMFVIITDGYENASREYNKNNIKKLINKHSKWEFVYIGADIGSYAAGGEIGIKESHIASYKKDKKGTSILFDSISNLGCCMMCEEAVTDSWKKDLDNYIENNTK